MKPLNKEDLSGSVERITFHNEENGFCVLRVKVKGHKDLVTILGNTPSISAGEYIKCTGSWYNDNNHGQQFKAETLKTLPPSSLEGIEKYLGSGLIKGIGPHFAKRLIKAFGENVFEVIENKPNLLSKVEGIGKFRAKSICSNWQEQKIVREIMVFLQSHGITTTRATRIYKTYGEAAIEIVKDNPYKLAEDILGIGFVSADIIAKNLGIESNSLIRARAGINHILLEATSEGHCGLPIGILAKRTKELLEIEFPVIGEAIERELEAHSLIKDTIDGENVLFLASYYIYERAIAQMLKELLEGEIFLKNINEKGIISWVENKLKINLAENQKAALLMALNNKVMVITGGPGTGKTTLVNSILAVLEDKKLKVQLCAPTGRAAKRLSEVTGFEALTIHRLLDSTYNGFRRDKDFPIQCDYLVVDEASMIDVSLFYALLQALPSQTSLLIVGDIDQLPSVGAGQLLYDIINSKIIPCVKLTEIFRQAASSNIIKTAHNINLGKLPNLEPELDSDFYFIKAEPGEEIIKKLIHLVKERIPSKFGFHPINDIQVLSPMQRGGSGVRALNTELQKELNPYWESGVSKYGQRFAIGDKIMQTINDYDKEIYNGDIGIIISLNNVEQQAIINFDGREIIYDYNDLDRINLAYAVTIHKSQGSEYPVVIIPLTMQNYMMLKRNLLYTGITRGKKLVIILGQKEAIDVATKNTSGLIRYSKLREWLIEKS